MKKNTIIFTQSSLNSRVVIMAALTSVMLASNLLTNPALFITSANSANTTVIKPTAKNETEKSDALADSDINSGSESVPKDIFSAGQTTVIPSKPIQTLASTQKPLESELSQANQNLLTENAKLQREMNDLETQVNVLMAERSGQIFLYGAATAAASFIVGGILALLLFGRRRESKY